eukprot:4928495-Amphidinium_carterae.1
MALHKLMLTKGIPDNEYSCDNNHYNCLSFGNHSEARPRAVPMDAFNVFPGRQLLSWPHGIL